MNEEGKRAEGVLRGGEEKLRQERGGKGGRESVGGVAGALSKFAHLSWNVLLLPFPLLPPLPSFLLSERKRGSKYFSDFLF